MNKSKTNSDSKIEEIVPQFLVKDLEKSISYYKEQLGFDVAFVYDTFYAGVMRDGLSIHLKNAPGNITNPPREDHTEKLDAYVAVTGISKLFDELTSKGADVVSELENQPWGCIEFYVRDPDGNVICFSENT